MSMPLKGIRVLDWTIWQQGPVATAMLGDIGAEVIKIEERVTGDPGRGVMRIAEVSTDTPSGRNWYFENNNRNKKSITLDLKKQKAKEIVYRLAEKSDVFVQNFRKGVASKMGLDYKTLSLYNPQLIYANASGWGPNGPDAEKPSMDYLGLARSGMMTIVGEEGMPPLGMRGGISDQIGAVMTAYGILVAIITRERQGIGQEIDVSLLGSMISLQGIAMSACLLTGQGLKRSVRAKASNPLWNHYQCKDGKWLALAMLQSDRYWPDFCRALGIDKLEKDPKFENLEARAKNSEELVSILDEIFSTKPRFEWINDLELRGLICGVVNDHTDVVADQQVLTNKYIVDFEHPTMGLIKVVGCPILLSKTPASVRLPAPELGQHTEEILIEIGGYTWEEITQLKEEEVI